MNRIDLSCWPDLAYSRIYSDLADKVKLTGVVYGILEEVMEKGTLNAFSYEDMLDELASKDQVAGHSHILFAAIFPISKLYKQVERKWAP